MTVINVKKGVNPVNGTVGNDEINLKESIGNGIIINANAGNDVINVTRGDNHTINAGAGADFVTVASGKNYKIDLGEGNDRVDLLGAEGHQVVAVAGTNNINVNNGSSYVITGGTGIDRLTIKGTNSNIKADLGAGEDVLGMATGSGNEIHGGADKDYFIVSGGDNSIFYGNEGNDTLRLYRGEGHTLYAGAGDDSMLVTEANNSKVYGVSGKNQIMFFGGIGNEYYGGDEKDNITIKHEAQGVKVTGGTNATVVNIQAGDKHIIDLSASTSTATQIMAGSGISVTGGDKRDTLRVWGATDKLTADLGKGNDLINVKGGTNMIFRTGDGNDELQIIGGSQNQYYAGYGDDVVTISGGTANSIDLEQGDDTFTMTGGEVEKLLLNTGKNKVKIAGGQVKQLTTGLEKDVIEISKATVEKLEYRDYNNGAVELTLGESSLLKSAALGRNADTVYLAGGTIGKMETGRGDDTVWLFGGEVQDTLSTGAGDDQVVLFGGTNIKIDTGDHNDTIFVYTSDDVASKNSIRTGSGNDTVNLGGRGTTVNLSEGRNVVNLENGGRDNVISLGQNGDTVKASSVDNKVYNLEIYGGKVKDVIDIKCYLEHSVVRGGEDDDTIIVGTSSSQNPGIYNQAIGNVGNDTITCNNNKSAFIDGGWGNDIISCTNVTNSLIIGGLEDDTINLSNVHNSFIEGNHDADEINLNCHNKFNIQGDCDRSIIYGGLGDDTINVTGRLTRGLIMAGEGEDSFTITDDKARYNTVYGVEQYTINAGYNNTYNGGGYVNSFYLNGGNDNLLMGSNYTRDKSVYNDKFYVSSQAQQYNCIVGGKEMDLFSVAKDAKVIIDCRASGSPSKDVLNLVGAELSQMDVVYDVSARCIKFNDIYVIGFDYVDIVTGSSSLMTEGTKHHTVEDILNNNALVKSFAKEKIYDAVIAMKQGMGAKTESITLDAFGNGLESVRQGITAYMAEVVSSNIKD